MNFWKYGRCKKNKIIKFFNLGNFKKIGNICFNYDLLAVYNQLRKLANNQEK